METIQQNDSGVGNDNSEPVIVVDAESRKPQHMAFTIHFADANKNGAVTKNIQEKVSNYVLKHRRNQSLPTTAENKATKGEVNSALAVSSTQAPVAAPLIATPNRPAGYQSEGYFSSDQDEDLRNRSGFFVRKLKNLDKGLRTTNLAQDKKNMAEQTSQTKLHNSPHMGRHEFGDFHVEEPSLKSRLDELKRRNNAANDASTLSGRQDEELAKEAWLLASTSDDEIEAQIQLVDKLIGEEEIDIDLSNDTASEAGTYTIERDVECLEEDQARQHIDNVVSGEPDPGEVGSADVDAEDFKMSSYRNGANWINDWATQVAKHTHQHEPEPHPAVGLPPLPATDKHRSPSLTTRIPSPVSSPNCSLPPSGRRNAPPSPTRNPRSPVHLPADSTADVGFETESYLRATESVVTAMQARMSLSMDSGGESDVDTSHSYKAVDRGPGTPEGRPLQRRSSEASDCSPRRCRPAHSDSGSDAGNPDAKSKKVEPPPLMSLRRARLENDPVPAPAPVPAADNRKKRAESVSSTLYKPKRALEPARPAVQLQPRQAKASSPKPEPAKTFSRTDCGRFSVRATKPAAQAPAKPIAVAKKDAKKDGKKSGGRSNSTLSSREVEFQNWKRRKSYDPMKAAAEGKKKDAAKKATFNNNMTQSYTTAEELSPSHSSSVLRSASFHGTLGMAGPKYTSSEDDATVSAEEDEESPTNEFASSPLAPVAGSPTKSATDVAIGSSRVSLHSTASNSSIKGRTKPEALDSLVMAALSGLSNKLRGRSCILLQKLRFLYEEDAEKSEQLSAIIDILEGPATLGSPQGKSPSKELSETLKNLKRLESFINVLDEVLFDDEDFDDLDADQLQ